MFVFTIHAKLITSQKILCVFETQQDNDQHYIPPKGKLESEVEKAKGKPKLYNFVKNVFAYQ